MNLKSLVITGFLSLSILPALAQGESMGSGSSGGGDAIVCFDGSTIKSAALMDLYEGNNIFGDVHTLQGSHYLSILNSALDKIGASAYGLKTGFTERSSIKELAIHVEQKKRFISRSVELAPVNDSYEVFLPKDCKIVQAAIFVDKNTILFDKNIWDKFSELDKAALILHEAVYWYDRMSNFKFDSRRTRRVVSTTFTDFVPENVRQGISNDFTLCESAKWGNDTGVGVTVFTLDERTGEINFLFLDGDPVYSKKTMQTYKLPILSRDKNDFTSYTSAARSVSLFEQEDFVQIASTAYVNNEGNIIGTNVSLIGSKKTSYPARKLADQSLRCSPCDKVKCSFLK